MIPSLVALLLGLSACAPPESGTVPPPQAAAITATHGDFTITTDQGPLTLSSLRGKVVVVYFGYAACPDVCPTTLSDMASAVVARSLLRPHLRSVFIRSG